VEIRCQLLQYNYIIILNIAIYDIIILNIAIYDIIIIQSLSNDNIYLFINV